MEFLDRSWAMLQQHAPSLLGALVMLLIGWPLVGWLVRLFKKVLIRREADPTIVSFLTSAVRFVVKLVLLVAVIDMAGVHTTSFLAVLGVAGLAVGLALKDSLSNFASGILIILFKPFRVGDTVETQGHMAVVDKITILYTYLRTFDNRIIVIPNGPLATDIVINHSTEPFRRVDIALTASYGDDLHRVRQVLLATANAHPHVLQEPKPPAVTLEAWAPSALEIKLRAWCATEHYWEVLWDLREQAKLAFDAAGLEIPLPQTVTYNRQEATVDTRLTKSEPKSAG